MSLVLFISYFQNIRILNNRVNKLNQSNCISESINIYKDIKSVNCIILYFRDQDHINCLRKDICSYTKKSNFQEVNRNRTFSNPSHEAIIHVLSSVCLNDYVIYCVNFTILNDSWIWFQNGKRKVIVLLFWHLRYKHQSWFDIWVGKGRGGPADPTMVVKSLEA